MKENKNGFMAGKKGVVLGVANNRSIAWSITKALRREGAEVALTYQGDVFKKRVMPLAEEISCPFLVDCDVSNPENLEELVTAIKQHWGKLDFFVHAVAYTDKKYLGGRYLETSRENFAMTMDISCFSLTSLCQKLSPLMVDGGSILTLTYYGSQRYIPNYNIMGVAKAALEASVHYLAVDLASQNIRINALSAGTVKTLAASGIDDFRHIMLTSKLNAPLRRNVTLEEVGNAGFYLLSDLSSGVTGFTHYVDCGFHTMGMMDPDTVEEVESAMGHSLLG